MGTRLKLRVRASDRASGLAVIQDALGVATRYESFLSSWTYDSEMGRLNRSRPHQTVRLSPVLTELLRQAFFWSEETGGAFDPTIGALVDAWDVRGPGRVPLKHELTNALGAVASAGLSFDATNGTVQRLSRSTWIDSGGFGKGAALAAVRTSLVRSGIGDALIDFGGQIVALGSPGGGRDGWPVVIAHPERRSKPTARLLLTDVSVATSGGSERWRVVRGREVSHVLDPRTGVPVASWGSVTVVSPDPLGADALSTALFVLGPAAAMEWARTRAEFGVFLSVVGADGEVRESWNEPMEAWFDPDGRGLVQ